MKQNSYSTFWKPILLLNEPATQTGRNILKATLGERREKNLVAKIINRLKLLIIIHQILLRSTLIRGASGK